MSYVGIGNRQDYIADFPTQEFSGNSTTTTFTLNFEAVTGAVRVAVDNVLQPADGSSYYVNGNSLTFTSAPASGTNNISVVYLGTVRNISSVSDNAITAAKLNSAAITGQTAETSIADDDLVLIYDDSATALRKMTKSNFTSGLATVNGITEADAWRVTTNFTNVANGVAEAITSNWERADVNFEKIGTGLTESSGVFSFPSTGKYLIIALASYYPTSATSDVQFYSEITTNNGSSYQTLGLALSGAAGSDRPENVGFNYICDVTETTNTKIRFGTVGATYITWQGNTNSQRIGFTCIRLGDT